MMLGGQSGWGPSGSLRQPKGPQLSHVHYSARTTRLAFLLFHTQPNHCCIMNAAVTNMAVMFGAMQVAKRIPFDENPEYVRYAQLVYITSQLLCLAVFYYCSIQVRVNRTAYLQIKRKNDLTVLKYVNAKNPMVCCSFISYGTVAGPW